MRTFDKCFENIKQNLINYNKNYEFDIYILTEYVQNDKSGKHSFKINVPFQQFKKNIENTYHPFLKKIYIESNENKINYPNVIINSNKKEIGPWKCLYRNHLIFEYLSNDNINLHTYDIFIRIRPDIILTTLIELQSINIIDKNIHIVSGNKIRLNSWLHNRDWDTCVISNYDGILLFSKYYNFLLNIKKENYKFDMESHFNFKGYWEKNTIDYSIIATQLFLYFIEDNDFNLLFDSPDYCFTEIIRN